MKISPVMKCIHSLEKKEFVGYLCDNKISYYPKSEVRDIYWWDPPMIHWSSDMEDAVPVKIMIRMGKGEYQIVKGDFKRNLGAWNDLTEYWFKPDLGRRGSEETKKLVTLYHSDYEFEWVVLEVLV